MNLLNDRSVFGITASQNALFNFLGATPFAPLATGLRNSLTTTNFPGTVQLLEDASGQFPFDENRTVFFPPASIHNVSPRNSGYLRFNVADSHFENAAPEP